MYSVVLMMAMTEAPDMTAFLKKRGGGCDGGCVGSYGGCRGYDACGCHGGGGGKKARKSRGHGCGGGCYGGGGGCYGGGGYGGGCMGGYGGGCYGGGGYGGGCMGGYGGGYGGGCYGGYGGQIMGGQIMGAPMGTPAPAPAPAPAPKPMGMIAAPATIVVSLPADAALKVDGVATKATDAVRTFATPALAAGQSYYYTLTAEVVRDGKTLTVNEQVTVRAGETTQVKLADAAFGLTVAAK